jgi:hypothetical protein
VRTQSYNTQYNRMLQYNIVISVRYATFLRRRALAPCRLSATVYSIHRSPPPPLSRLETLSVKYCNVIKIVRAVFEKTAILCFCWSEGPKFLELEYSYSQDTGRMTDKFWNVEYELDPSDRSGISQMHIQKYIQLM